MAGTRNAIRVLKSVHRWIGLVLGLHFALIATTGAIYIFQPELSAWNRRNFQVTPGDIGPDAVVEKLRRRFPNWVGEGLEFPQPESPFYKAYFPPEETEGTVYYWKDVYVNPGDGEIVGEIDNGQFNIDGILQVAIQLHINLCSGEWGRKFVDYSVVLFVVTLISGAILWWPGIKGFAKGFVLRLRRNSFVALYDCHRVSGVVAVPFLLVMAGTGLLWGFPGVVEPVIYFCFRESRSVSADEEEKFVSQKPKSSDVLPLPLNRFAALAKDRFPDSRLQSIWIDPKPDGVCRAYLKFGAMPPPEGVRQQITFDKYSGEVLRVRDGTQSSLAESLIKDWAAPLHYGWFGGLATKILYLLATLAVDGLFLSGVAMWWIRNGRKRRGHGDVASQHVFSGVS